MPFNGSGTFTLVSGNPVVTGTVISSTVQNNTMADVANGLTGCITRTGQSAALANLPMGGFKHTGAASAASNGEYLVYGQTGANFSSVSVGALTVTGAAALNGATTIGDAASDVITINGTPFAPNMAATRVYRPTAQTSGNVVVFTTVDFARTSGYSVGTGVWTTPAGYSGLYQINFNLKVSNTSGITFGNSIYISKNNNAGPNAAAIYDFSIQNNSSQQLAGSVILSLADGDAISIRLASSNFSATVQVTDSASMSIARIG